MLLVTVLVLVAACRVDRGDYVAKNEALLAELPVHPRASEVERFHTGFNCSGDDDRFQGPIKGYSTTVRYLVPDLSIADVRHFYLTKVSPLGWSVTWKTPIQLSFADGKRGLRITMDRFTVDGRLSPPVRPGRPGWPSISEDRVYQYSVLVNHDRPCD